MIYPLLFSCCFFARLTLSRTGFSIVYVVCLILMLASAAFGGGLTMESAALAVVNAVIPTLAAMGAYELVFAKLDK